MCSSTAFFIYWFCLQVDNRGNRLVGTAESSAINIPAVAAAQAIKRYSSQAPDELSLEVCLLSLPICM